MLAGPLAGVLLDRFDRKRVMIASDLVRAVVALGFILTVNRTEHLAALRAQRAADAGLAVLHQRARRHSALHRHQRGTAHRQLADPDHAVDHALARRVSGRRQRDAVRLSAGPSWSIRSRF